MLHSKIILSPIFSKWTLLSTNNINDSPPLTGILEEIRPQSGGIKSKNKTRFFNEFFAKTTDINKGIR